MLDGFVFYMIDQVVDPFKKKSTVSKCPSIIKGEDEKTKKRSWSCSKKDSFGLAYFVSDIFDGAFSHVLYVLYCTVLFGRYVACWRARHTVAEEKESFRLGGTFLDSSFLPLLLREERHARFD